MQQQDKIRALKSKPDEYGVLTLLRQLKFLQTTTFGGDGAGRANTTAATAKLANVGGGHTVRPPHGDGSRGGARAVAAPPGPIADAVLGGRVRDQIGVRDGAAAGAGSATVPTNVLADHEIERLLLEEL